MGKGCYNRPVHGFYRFINKISVNNLFIDFIDPDGNNAKANNEVTIPYDVSFFYPNLTDAVNELNGHKYLDIPYNIYFEDMRGNDVVYYEHSTDKRTVTIPDVIDFVNPTGDNVVVVSGYTRKVTVPDYIDFVDTNGYSVVGDVNGVNTVTLNSNSN